MEIATYIFAILVAVEHLYIMYLETFATTSDSTARVFGMNKEELGRKSVNTLFKNQGVYNGLLALLIIVTLFVGDMFFLRLFMGYVILVAAYGSMTGNKMILLKQGGLAIIALAVSLM